MPAATILIVEDDPVILRLLEVNFELEGFSVLLARDGFEGIEIARTEAPDLVVSDIMMPRMSGIELVAALKGDNGTADIPIILLSAKAQTSDLKAGMDAGADDYVTKPYAVGELLARLRAALRRAAAPAGEPPAVRFGDVEVDLARREVARDGERVHLTPREYRLLAELARHPGRVLTHRALLSAVWGPEYGTETHYLRVYMANLRRKLEEDPARPRHLVTETGVGYRLRS